MAVREALKGALCYGSEDELVGELAISQESLYLHCESQRAIHLAKNSLLSLCTLRLPRLLTFISLSDLGLPCEAHFHSSHHMNET